MDRPPPQDPGTLKSRLGSNPARDTSRSGREIAASERPEARAVDNGNEDEGGGGTWDEREWS